MGGGVMDRISPDREQERPPVDPPGRRRRRGRAAALILGLVAASAGAFAAVNNEEVRESRVRTGTSSFPPKAVDGALPISQTSTFSWGDEWLVSYRPAGELRFGFNLMVEGSEPVTVLSVEPVQPYGVDLIGRFLGRGDGNDFTGGSAERTMPFRSFRLTPGEFRFVEFRYRFFDCGPPASNAAVVSGTKMTIRFKAGDRTRTTVESMPWSIAFKDIPSCEAYGDERQKRRLAGRPETVTEDAVGFAGIPLE